MCKRNLLFFFVFLNILFVVSCGKTSKTFHSDDEFFKFLNDKNNGFCKEKIVDDKLIKMYYMPDQYLKVLQKDTIDTNKGENTSTTFLLSIEYNNKTDKNLLVENIEDFQQYEKRVKDLSFRMEEYIYVEKQSEKSYMPVLTNFENMTGVNKKNKITIVFDKNISQLSDSSSNTICVVYEDMIFGTGVNKFTFDKNTLSQNLTLDF